MLRPAMAADIDTLRVSITAVCLVNWAYLDLAFSGAATDGPAGEGQKDEGLV